MNKGIIKYIIKPVAKCLFFYFSNSPIIQKMRQLLMANSRGKAVCLSNKSNLYFVYSSPLTLIRSVKTDYVQYVSKINTIDFELLIFFRTLRLA